MWTCQQCAQMGLCCNRRSSFASPTVMRGAFESAAPCRRARWNAKSCTESCKIPALIQSWCRVGTEPCKTPRVFNPPYLPLAPRIASSGAEFCFVFDLFSDLLSGHLKSDFLEASGIARILPDGQNFLRSPKKQKKTKRRSPRRNARCQREVRRVQNPLGFARPSA